jgi:hypothetical protein
MVERSRYGSVIWPERTTEAWYLLCDLARVAPDNALSAEELKDRLWEHGEGTKRTTVEKILEAYLQAEDFWR